LAVNDYPHHLFPQVTGVVGAVGVAPS
jgi:hypothetical protein